MKKLALCLLACLLCACNGYQTVTITLPDGFAVRARVADTMKNTLIDLDMVFIGSDKRVTSVAEQVPHSYTYTPDDEVAYALGYGQYVLELAAKTAAKHGVTEGAEIKFELAEK